MRIDNCGVAAILIASAVFAMAQSPSDNLQVCLSGQYPALCNHAALTPEQLREARAAEKRENLKVCMTGQYPALCNHSLLDDEEAAAVRKAEREENLKVCSSGMYPALCNHSLLSAHELKTAQEAERAENLKLCMDGHYKSVCNHTLLTPEQAKAVAAAETSAAASKPISPAGTAKEAGSRPTCQSGLSIVSVDGDGKIIRLDDGSLWKVDDVDTVTSSIWLPATAVVVCGDKIINVDDDESVDAQPLSSARGGQATLAGYTIEASSNDETFVINGEVFTAKTYCFNFDRGDHVLFTDGSPTGACASATLLNLRTGEVCEVWCGD